jgi:Rod binding domain-containing protein
MTSDTLAATAAYAPPALPVATDAQQAKAAKVAHDFEASFLQVMLGEMFKGVSAGQFGGGAGEDAFKSFLTDSFAQTLAKHGGVGLSKPLTHELLKMQGLSEGAPA